MLPTLTVRAAGEYDGALRRAVVALKSGRRDVADALAAHLAPLLTRDDRLVAVPTTAARRRTRGMDNVVLLAQLASKIAGARMLPALRRAGTDAQRGRTRAARLAAQGRFLCDASIVAGRRVVLIDDVCTTGSTLEDCAHAIRSAAGIVEEAVVVALA